MLISVKQFNTKSYFRDKSKLAWQNQRSRICLMCMCVCGGGGLLLTGRPVSIDDALQYLLLHSVAVAHEFPWTRYKVVGTFSLILGILSMFFTLAHVRTNNCPSGVVTLITWTSTGACKIYVISVTILIIRKKWQVNFFINSMCFIRYRIFFYYEKNI